jgi:hypothetical protein
MFNIRLRNLYLVYGTIAAMVLYTLVDPDLGLITNMPVGSSTLLLFVLSVKAFLYLLLLHWSRKALYDYEDADYQIVASQAIRTPQGAGLLAISISIMTLAIAIVIAAVIYSTTSSA